MKSSTTPKTNRPPARNAVLALLLSLMLAPNGGRAQDTLAETVVEAQSPAPAPAPRRTPVVRPTPPPAPAPVALPEPVVELEPLILSDKVNGLMTGTPLIDVPQSLTIFSEAQIDEQGFLSIGEIVDYTPGLTNSQGEGHRDAVVFRGVRSSADFYIDGVRDDVQYFRPLYNIEQVEVLRGPSALFFGRGGTGGIINRVMKKPVINDEFTNLGFTIDSFGATYSDFDYNQTLGGGVPEGGKGSATEPWGALRLNAFYETLDNHRDFYDGDRIGVNPTMAILLGPDTRLDLSYEYNDFDNFIDRGIPTGANGLPVEALSGVVFGDPDLNIANFESNVLRATLNHRFSDDWKGRVTASYGDYDKAYQNFYASGYDQATDLVTIDGYVDSLTRQNLVFSGHLIGEVATGPIDHKVIIGAELITTSSDQNRFDSFWDTNQSDTEIFNAANFRLQGGSAINAAGQRATNSFNTDLADDTRVTIGTYSFFLQDEIALNEHFDLILGGRFDTFDIEVFNAVNGETRTRVDEQFSPRLGVIFKPFENVSIYGSHSKSFLPRSGEQFDNINDDKNALDPNIFTNLEAGVKVDIRPDLSFTMAVFEIEESSPQVSDTDPATLDVIDTKTTGFEAQLAGKITDQWSVLTGYSFLDGEQVDRGGPTGLRPRELPEHSFSLWNNYRMTDRFGLGLGLVYQGDSFINNTNTATMPGYTRVDASAYYKLSEKTRLQVNVENLLDTDYFPTAHSMYEVTVGRPINAAFSIQTKF
jgi:catecholate siderophore receptor